MGTASGNSTWQNSPSVATPITAARLEAIEDALDANAASIAALPALADVATSGSYTDLTDTPTIPTDLDDLSGVDLTTETPTTGDVLVFDGTDWTPQTPTTGVTAYSATVTIPTGWTTSTGITVTGLVDTDEAIVGPANSSAAADWGSDWDFTTGADTLTVTGTAPDAAVSAKLIWWT